MPNAKIAPPTPPAFLTNVPKGVFSRLDVHEVLRDAVTLANHPSTYGPLVAFANIESALGAARRQQRRIASAKMALSKPSRLRRRVGTLFDDVHFYLICWARIAKLGRFVAQATRFRRTGLVLRRYHAELEEMIVARDHLEHFEERLPGGRKHHTLTAPGDLFNLVNQYATFGGRKFDVGRDSLRQLVALVRELQSAVLFDALEAIASADPTRLAFLLRRAATLVHVARISRRIKSNL